MSRLLAGTRMTLRRASLKGSPQFSTANHGNDAAVPNPIVQHYSRGGRLRDDIINAFSHERRRKPEIDRQELLSRVDAFSSRGRLGREALFVLLKTEVNKAGNETNNRRQCQQILDIGCGIGGAARYLQRMFDGSSVLGIDITPEFIEVGNHLLKQVLTLEQQEQVKLQVGSALELPCPDASIDLAWTEHVQMNIANKLRFYTEIIRVLRTGGWVAIHDVILGDGDTTPQYPCPWAENEDQSFLVTESDMKDIMAQAGLEVREWVDTTGETVAFLETARKASIRNCTAVPTLSVNLLMGPTAPTKVKHHLENLQSGRTKTVMAIATKPPPLSSKL